MLLRGAGDTVSPGHEPGQPRSQRRHERRDGVNAVVPRGNDDAGSDRGSHLCGTVVWASGGRQTRTQNPLPQPPGPAKVRVPRRFHGRRCTHGRNDDGACCIRWPWNSGPEPHGSGERTPLDGGRILQDGSTGSGPRFGDRADLIVWNCGHRFRHPSLASAAIEDIPP